MNVSALSRLRLADIGERARKIGKLEIDLRELGPGEVVLDLDWRERSAPPHLALDPRALFVG
jgi:hypothetical protein